ncbi:MAG: hypothetical protein KJP02_10585 [Octadecabacter sp.]|jgi:hypothetical protein|nr:hypothetical protein [Octadecabacter sp.]
MLHLRLILAAAAVASLSACLDNDLERGLAGAAAGAVIADATGGNVVTGAVVGGAAGALCDEVTNICR